VKLVLFAREFPKDSETFIVDKLLGLLDRGWDVHLVAELERREDAHGFPRLQEPAIAARVHAWPPPSARRHLFALRWLLRAALTHPLALLRCAVRQAKLSRRGAVDRIAFAAPMLCLRPDVLHFEFGSLAAHRIDLVDVLGCRTSVSFRGFDLNYYALETPGFYDEVFAKIDRIHVLGADLERRAHARGMPDDADCVRIPPSVDTAFFAPPSRGAGEAAATQRPLRLLTIGRLHWKKGIEYALAAVRQLVDAGIALDYRLVGDGPFEQATRACIADLALEAHVQLLGSRAREEVRETFDWADVLLHAAVSEGFCNAVLEAQAMEVPVVCSDADGLAENVVDGVTGFVVERRDAAALAESVARLAHDEALRRRMGRAGRARVCDHFGREQQLDAIEMFYRGLA
jgi:colanic acid/amylovoran biosynthesis glycosyltransferase